MPIRRILLTDGPVRHLTNRAAAAGDPPPGAQHLPNLNAGREGGVSPYAPAGCRRWLDGAVPNPAAAKQPRPAFAVFLAQDSQLRHDFLRKLYV